LKELAEREGFEPPDPCGSTVFKTAAFDHSATSPERAKIITDDLQLIPEIQVKTSAKRHAGGEAIGFFAG
jgi:hypothetical protein